MKSTKMLNIGCGSNHHQDWINLDISSDEPSVLPVDITKGLPFPSASVTVCYCSHVLEHLDKVSARNLLTECFRVLETGGGIRLVVPDLEGIVQEYLLVLNELVSGKRERDFDYDWIMLELYDQTVRNSSGGEMANFLINLKEEDRAYVRTRIGVEAEKYWKKEPETAKRFRVSGLLHKEKWRRRIGSLREKVAGWLVRVIAGKAAFLNFQTGLFRSRGEIHQWMYDRYSLKRLLEQVGFENVKVCTANESRIPGYEKYSLDSENGAIRKPDSLYIEASKP